MALDCSLNWHTFGSYKKVSCFCRFHLTYFIFLLFLHLTFLSVYNLPLCSDSLHFSVLSVSNLSLCSYSLPFSCWVFEHTIFGMAWFCIPYISVCGFDFFLLAFLRGQFQKLVCSWYQMPNFWRAFCWVKSRGRPQLISVWRKTVY